MLICPTVSLPKTLNDHMHQKHHINLVSYEKRYHSDGAGGGKRAAADKDKDKEGEEEEKGGASPKKRARLTAAAKAAGLKEEKVKAKVETRRAPATEKCVLCDNAFPLAKLFGHVTTRHSVAADTYERVKAALAASERGELVK